MGPITNSQTPPPSQMSGSSPKQFENLTEAASMYGLGSWRYGAPRFAETVSRRRNNGQCAENRPKHWPNKYLADMEKV
jgi:hypothetical protein